MSGPTQQGTPCLLAPTSVDDFLVDISGLFVESHIVDLKDIIDDQYHLFAKENPSLVVSRANSDPHVHSLHDQSS